MVQSPTPCPYPNHQSRWDAAGHRHADVHGGGGWSWVAGAAEAETLTHYTSIKKAPHYPFPLVRSTPYYLLVFRLDKVRFKSETRKAWRPKKAAKGPRSRQEKANSGKFSWRSWPLHGSWAAYPKSRRLMGPLSSGRPIACMLACRFGGLRGTLRFRFPSSGKCGNIPNPSFGGPPP